MNYFIGGFLLLLYVVPATAFRQQVVPDRLLGRVMAVNRVATWGFGATFGFFIGGVIAVSQIMATNLIEGMNSVHKLGVSLDGSTGADFFTGTDASNIAVNKDLVADVRKLQLSANTDTGDNTVAVNLLKWLEAPQQGLGKMTVAQHYNQAVATYGQEMANINNRLADQEVISHMLTQQRAGVSGVSLDEEMTSMIQYQRAYQGSAKLISTINELFQTILAM